MKILLLLLILALSAVPGFAAATGVTCADAAAEVSGGDANVVVTLPTHLAGDIFILSIINHADNTVSSVVGSTTWTQKEIETATSGFDVWVYWTRAASAADSSATVTFGSATGGRFGRVCSIRGAKQTGDPIEAFSALEILITDPDTAAGVTSVSANALICATLLESNNQVTAATYVPTSPTSLTRVGLIDNDATDDNVTFDFACATKAAAGATGNVTVDFTGTLNGAYFMVMALTEAIPGGIYKYYNSSLEPSKPLEATPPTIERWRDQIRPMQGLQAVALTKLGRLDEALRVLPHDGGD